MRRRLSVASTARLERNCRRRHPFCSPYLSRAAPLYIAPDTAVRHPRSSPASLLNVAVLKRLTRPVCDRNAGENRATEHRATPVSKASPLIGGPHSFAHLYVCAFATFSSRVFLPFDKSGDRKITISPVPPRARTGDVVCALPPHDAGVCASNGGVRRRLQPGTADAERL